MISPDAVTATGIYYVIFIYRKLETIYLDSFCVHFWGRIENCFSSLIEFSNFPLSRKTLENKFSFDTKIVSNKFIHENPFIKNFRIHFYFSVLIISSDPIQRPPVSFVLDNVEASSSYRLILFAVNAKGRSEPVIIDDISFKGVAKFTGTGELYTIYTPDPLSAQFIDIYSAKWNFPFSSLSRFETYARIV